MSSSVTREFVPVMSDSTAIEVDTVTEAELKENGFRSTRRTKLVCTIGPVTCGFEQLEALAVGGMNVARINMCHGTRNWHRMVIERVRRLNEEKGYAVAIMMDTEGSEIHMGDLGGASSAKAEVSSSVLYRFSSYCVILSRIHSNLCPRLKTFRLHLNTRICLAYLTGDHDYVVDSEAEKRLDFKFLLPGTLKSTKAITHFMF